MRTAFSPLRSTLGDVLPQDLCNSAPLLRLILRSDPRTGVRVQGQRRRTGAFPECFFFSKEDRYKPRGASPPEKMVTDSKSDDWPVATIQLSMLIGQWAYLPEKFS